jgi:hypothetical protein
MSTENPPDASFRAVTTIPREPVAAAPMIRRPVARLLRAASARSLPMATYQLNRIGRSGLAGIGLMFCAGVFLFSAVLPQYREIASLRSDILEAQRRGVAAPSPHVRLNRFLDDLPKRGELPNITGKIFKLAAGAGVTLDRGRYELAPLHSGRLARLRMSFPIKGQYPAIRRFIDATLIAIPSAAVEGLRIERKAVGDANVDADLRFSIFVRNES